MGAILTLLFTGLSKIPGVLGDYFKRKQEIQLIKAETDRQLAIEHQKMVAETARADAERATVALGATGMWFKYVVFGMISIPFLSCLIGFPSYATMVFTNLSALPEWYLIMYTSIVAVIWGIPVKGSVMGYIFNGIKDSVQNRRQYKLEKKALERQDVFEVVKQLREGQPYVQKEVDLINKVIDVYEKRKAE